MNAFTMHSIHTEKNLPGKNFNFNGGQKVLKYPVLIGVIFSGRKIREQKTHLLRKKLYPIVNIGSIFFSEGKKFQNSKPISRKWKN